MNESTEHKRVEVVEHEGSKFVRIDPKDVNTSQMTLVKKVTDVVAAQVSKGIVKVVTRHGKQVETINHAKQGDYIVYDIGASDFKDIGDKLLACEKHAISKENFSHLYYQINEQINLDSQTILMLAQDLVLDNQDNKDFVDSSFVKDLKRYKYIGKTVFAARVPFNFVVKAPWGKDQFIKHGGFLIYDTNLEKSKDKAMYGMEGADRRIPGEFEKTYALGEGKEKKVIADTFKIAIKADRSPIAGLQFDNIDLAKAYQRAGKPIPSFLRKFVKK